MTATILLMILFNRLCIAPALPVYTMWRNMVNMEIRMEAEKKQILIDKELALFMEHLGLRESNNQWDIINQINCMGKYQFQPSTLKYLGYGHITAPAFRQNPNIFPPDLQDRLLIALIKSNETALKQHFCYCGKIIGGVLITKAGMLAGAHLGGARNVKLFLESDGQLNSQDLNMTSIKDYLKEFSLYNI
jgi:hypothetical protein